MSDKCYESEDFKTCCTVSSCIALWSSIILYVVAIGVGWGLVMLGAPAIIITIPVAAPLLCFLLVGIVTCSEDKGSTAFAVCFMIMWFCAGFIVFVGGIVFIVTGSMMDANNSNPDMRVGSFVAGVFAIVAGILCCCGSCGLTAVCELGKSETPKEQGRNTHV